MCELSEDFPFSFAENWNSVLILSFRGIKKETMLFLVYSKYFTKIKLIWTGSCWIVKHFQKHAINLRQTISHSCSSMTRSNAFVASCFHCSFSPCVLLNELYFVENTVWNLLIFRRERNSRKNFPEKSDLKNLKKKHSRLSKSEWEECLKCIWIMKRIVNKQKPMFCCTRNLAIMHYELCTAQATTRTIELYFW